MELPTTLLRHQTPPSGTAPHHDWLVLDPRAHLDPALGLWTARVEPHWRDWAQLGRIELTPLPRHRRRYLDWAGELTDQRGHVRPAARGVITPHLWTPERIELWLTPTAPQPRQETLPISLRRIGERWVGTVSGLSR